MCEKISPSSLSNQEKDVEEDSRGLDIKNVETKSNTRLTRKQNLSYS